MTPEEVKADVDAAIDEFAYLIAQGDESSGIPRPPTIELSEVSFPPTEFDFGLEPQPQSESGAGDGGGITVTYPRTGPCCFPSGDCFIETESECGTDGGEYQGDDGVCVPNPCVFGACCDALGSCFIKTRAGCVSIGGTYQGDGTSCVPNPCTVMSSCSCGFSAFDGSGRKFLTMTTRYQDSGSDDSGGSFSSDATETATYDPVSCSLLFARSGGSSSTDPCNATLHDSGACLSPPFATTEAGFQQSLFFGDTPANHCSQFGPCHLVTVCEPLASATSNTHTATTHDVMYMCGASHSSATASWHIELSNECTPI